MPRKASTITFALVLLMAVSAMAATTGKIAGRVTDASGTPLIGATVMIVGTSYGAMTDQNGEYFIINLQPGNYDVIGRMVGMGDQTMQGVSVLVDMTTRVDLTLNPVTVGSTVVTVTDQRGLITMGQSASVSVVSRDEIKTMPVAGVADIVGQQAGTSQQGGTLRVRGGRSGEVAYIVDGVAQMDPQTNTYDASIPLSAVAETSVMTGGFGAEYGNAQSGIINVVTREGGRNYSGSLSMNGNDFQTLGLASDWAWGYPGTWWPGDHFAADPDVPGSVGTEFAGNKPAMFAEARLNAEASIGGPEPITQLLLPAMGLNVGGDVRLFGSVEWLQTGGGEDGNYAMRNWNWQETWSGNGKLTIRPTPRTKINLTTTFRDQQAGFYSNDPQYGWSYNLFEQDYIDPNSGDTILGQSVGYALPTRFWTNSSYGFNLTQTLSDASFLEFKLNQYTSEYSYKIRDPEGGWLGEDWTIEDWLNYTPTRVQDSRGYYRSGASRFAWDDEQSVTSTARVDLTSQVNQQHQLKLGIEGNYYDVFTYSVDTASGGNIYTSYYHHFPHQFAAYAQDKMEFRGMIVNAGVRFDYFDPNFDEYPADLTDPVNPDAAPGDPDYIRNPVSVSAKYHLSPRVGFSHPITERDVLHFTYGHYFQVPMLANLYDGSNFDLTGAYPIIGNPDLAPEETIAYEVGIKHQFDDITLLDVTGFYKDITGLTDMQKNFFSAVDAYDIYINADYGNVRGAEFSIMRRPSNFISFNANYTYSISQGKSSNATQNYTYNWAGWVVPRRESPLNWDQRHSVNASFDFRIPRGEGPLWGANHWLEGFGATVQFGYGSGYPYTASAQGTADPEINGQRMPWTETTDLKVNKTWWIGGTSVDLSVWVRNLFDRTNVARIIDTAWYDADQDGDGVPDHDPRGSYGTPDAYDTRRQLRFGLEFEW